ncbi:MAG: HEAT repeat domain-containing protein [Candidatus Melainabacteria bacterium]|nr:HEAT repeat domain-containing protein [Candidatus Melainabacteria bacterium]
MNYEESIKRSFSINALLGKSPRGAESRGRIIIKLIAFLNDKKEYDNVKQSAAKVLGNWKATEAIEALTDMAGDVTGHNGNLKAVAVMAIQEIQS